MEIDNPTESNEGSDRTKENGIHLTTTSDGKNESGFCLYPVSVNDSGEGLPYAPTDFPNPGDKWRWKTGRRITSSGYFIDRYLYAPPSLTGGGRTRAFASKLSVEQFIKTTFPGVDVNAFFASFSWKIPSMKLHESKGDESEPVIGVPIYSQSDPQFETVTCKAGNKMCISLVEGRNIMSNNMFCDACCAEPGFCRDCCCILCSKTVDLAYGGYSFIRCEATVAEDIICGHIAHIECGLRSYMAGTVGGSIGLDAEYCCRHCDMITELVPHVTKLLQTCESVDSRDNIEKILNVGVCILRGSQKTSARKLLQHIELAKAKLKSGAHLEDIWKAEDMSAVPAGSMDALFCKLFVANAFGHDM